VNQKVPYSRVYWTIPDDPMFTEVWANDKALATWLRLLILADQCYPSSAPLPAKSGIIRQLIDSGLVIERPGQRYTIRGLEKERAMRSQSGRNGAAVRWHSEGNANAMLDETRREKKSSGHNGQHANCLVCKPLQGAA
jgi:hypothetical protein